MDELNHKVNGADGSHRHNTHVFSLSLQPPLLCWRFPPKTGMSAYGYLPPTTSIGLYVSISSPAETRVGDGSEDLHIYT